MKVSTLLQSSDFAERQLGLVLRAFGYVSTNQPVGSAYRTICRCTVRTFRPGCNARQRRRGRRGFHRLKFWWGADLPENICPSWTAGDYKDERRRHKN